MKAAEIEALYRDAIARAFAHLHPPELVIVESPVCGLCVRPARGMVLLFLEEHDGLGEVLDTLLHELAHAEQIAEGLPLADNADHARRLRQAWARYIGKETGRRTGGKRTSS